MDHQTKVKYESKSLDLKAQLKKWEGEWAKSHDGSKPGREDIKANADIAEKYKRYQTYRDILSGKLLPPSRESPKKRRYEVPAETPLKRSRFLETPSKNRILEDEFTATPSISRKLFSPSAVTSLGPTPQRDGHVLGLFDLLVEREIGTPSKERMGSRSEVRGDVGSLTLTPRKRAASTDDEEIRLGRTPMSASKRRTLNTFMTPLKKRDGNSGGKTPSSVSRLQFETPQFLKRHTALPVVEEIGAGMNSMGVSSLRLPRKPMGRGLSEIVASLRKVEENTHDDDMDALREAESEQVGAPIPPRPKSAPEDILVADSQQMLGGFDDEGLYDSPVEDKTRDGNSLRTFKKKGQKRTTRKSNAKPVWTKRPTNTTEQADSDSELVPKTQQASGLELAADNGFGSGSEFEGEELEAKTSKEKKKVEKKEGPVKKAAKKVNELAHANFKRLKLRNYGAKGGPKQGSRFRRRR